MTASGGAPAQSVAGVLERRRRRGRGNEGFDDGCKVGLAVEGGGMRGVVSGAMLIGIEDLGFKGLFDAWYGTSSGSINLAYFATGARWATLAVYYDRLATRDFIDLRRPVQQRRPVIDMAILFDEILDRAVPLDYEVVSSSPVRIGFGVSDINARKGRVISHFASGGEVRDYLRAGAWIPLLAGPPVLVNGCRLVDGALYFPTPADVAADDGCTHVVLLATGSGAAKGRARTVGERYLARRLDQWSPGAGAVYRRRADEQLAARTTLRGDAAYRGMRTLTIAAASGAHAVSTLTIDRSALLDGARAGYVAVAQALATPGFRVPPFCLDLSDGPPPESR